METYSIVILINYINIMQPDNIPAHYKFLSLNYITQEFRHVRNFGMFHILQ